MAVAKLRIEITTVVDYDVSGTGMASLTTIQRNLKKAAEYLVDTSTLADAICKKPDVERLELVSATVKASRRDNLLVDDEEKTILDD